MKTHLLAVACASLLTFSLVACSSNSPKEETVAAALPEPVATPVVEAAPTPEPVKEEAPKKSDKKKSKKKKSAKTSGS